MPLAYAFKARARREIDRAAEWWSTNQPLAPGALRTDIEVALELLVEHPDIGTLLETAKGRRARRFYLNRTGYFLYDRVVDEKLEVLSFRHASRENEPMIG